MLQRLVNAYFGGSASLGAVLGLGKLCQYSAADPAVIDSRSSAIVLPPSSLAFGAAAGVTAPIWLPFMYKKIYVHEMAEQNRADAAVRALAQCETPQPPASAPRQPSLTGFVRWAASAPP